MGSVCSGGMSDEYSDCPVGSLACSRKFERRNTSSYKELPHPYSVQDDSVKVSSRYDSRELRIPFSSELKPSRPSKFMSSKVLGRAGLAGIERAVEVIDVLGSGISSLNPSNGFSAHVNFSRNKIYILAFEVANTITKGSRLLESLSKESIQFLKEEVLSCEGAQKLISMDTHELLSIAADDKSVLNLCREELNVFSGEVIRFGDLCKDPQWHNLSRYFSKLDSDVAVHKQFREDAELEMKDLTELAKNTSELYHELQVLDRFEQDYHQKLAEMDSLHLPRRGEGMLLLHSELKHQRKIVKSLKKKSLWSLTLEEVVEKLVDVVVFIHLEIQTVFSGRGSPVRESPTLGQAGLALHYANVICQIDNIACRPTCLPPNMRDTLYHGLPVAVKSALRVQLHKADSPKEEMSIPQIKTEMEKTLHWLVPFASNTTTANQGFGWVGEWANTGTETGKKSGGSVVRLQTLYHASVAKTDMQILELVSWLHRLVSLVRERGVKVTARSVRSPVKKGKSQLSQLESDLLAEVSWQGNRFPRSRSLGFGASRKREYRVHSVSLSVGSSPRGEGLASLSYDALDVIDGL